MRARRPRRRRRCAARRSGASAGGRWGCTRPSSNTDQWMRQFGVDVEEIDQWELVRRAETVDPARGRRGREWLERHAAGVHYDGERLTPELLERQVRLYHAMRELIDEGTSTSAASRRQPELTNHFATMDIAEAFLNDPYDWDGPKGPSSARPRPTWTRALTMQILQHLSRHAGAVRRRAPLPRATAASGTSATPASTPRGSPPAATTRPRTSRTSTCTPRTSTSPPAAPRCTTSPRPGDVHVRAPHPARRPLPHAGAARRARAVRRRTNERLMQAVDVRVAPRLRALGGGRRGDPARFGSNHIHAVPGDHVATLRRVCRAARRRLRRLRRSLTRHAGCGRDARRGRHRHVEQQGRRRLACPGACWPQRPGQHGWPGRAGIGGEDGDGSGGRGLP